MHSSPSPSSPRRTSSSPLSLPREPRLHPLSDARKSFRAISKRTGSSIVPLFKKIQNSTDGTNSSVSSSYNSPGNSSVRHHGCSMIADAGGVGGEAWTCDGQTNGNFIQFVCPSPWLLDGSGTYSVCRVRWSGRRWSTASYVDVVHIILTRCVPLHPNLVQWLRQVPNHTMALRRQRRPYYGTFQQSNFKGKTNILCIMPNQ